MSDASPPKKTFAIGKKMQSIDDEVVGVHRKKFSVPEQAPTPIEKRLSDLSIKKIASGTKVSPTRTSQVLMEGEDAPIENNYDFERMIQEAMEKYGE